MAAAALLSVSISASRASGQQPVVTSAPDPEISVTTPPVTRFINFTATPGSYVLLVKVSNTGTVDVLYPAIPSVDLSRVNSAAKVQVPTLAAPKTNSPAAVFAFVSSVPYDFSKVASGNGWNTLHLSNYAGITDDLIARAFGSEVAGPGARVIMSRATPGGRMAISRTPKRTLADSERTPCPSAPAHAYGASASSTCITKSLELTNPPVPMNKAASSSH